MQLEDLGWSPRVAEAFEPHRLKGLSPARVSLEHTHIYRVLSPEGERLARVAGRLRHDATGRADFPAVGDWVAVETPSSGDARIRAVLPRAKKSCTSSYPPVYLPPVSRRLVRPAVMHCFRRWHQTRGARVWCRTLR